MKRFIDSKYFILTIFLFSVINWTLNTMYLYLPLMTIIVFCFYIYDIDRMKLIPLTLGNLIAFQDIHFDLFLYLCIVLIVIVAIFDVIKQQMNNFKNNILTSMIILYVIMAASLMYSISISLSLFGLVKMAAYIFILFYFYNVKSDKKSDYVVKSILYLSFFIFLEIIIYFVMKANQPFKTSLQTFDLKWGSYNIISMFYLLIIPISAYWMIINQEKKYLLYILFFEITILVIMSTHGAYLATLVMAIPFCFSIYRNIEDKKGLMRKVLLFLMFALIFRLLVSNPTGMTESWYNRIGLITNREGKDLAFQLGISAFLSNPMFGTGVFTSPIYLSHLQSWGYNLDYFQNYFIQTLATLGIVGVIGFIYYVVTVIVETRRNFKYNQFVFYSFMCMGIQGLFDITIYIAPVMITLSILFSSLEKEKK